MYSRDKVSDLLGKTMAEVKVSDDKEQISFVSDCGREWRMYHDQDCCESVRVEDVVGEFSDLVGAPILMAEESVNSGRSEDDYDSETWTYYKLATIKGYVTIRWYGTSNGYYSESVDFEEVKGE